MDSKSELRKEQANLLRAMWSTHTHNSEPVREAFFRELERAVAWGQMAPVSMIGDMLCVALPIGSIFVMFPTPNLKAEFLQVLKILLQDDSSVGQLG